MKILWFSNTCANSSKYLNDRLVSGGWLQSLDLFLQKHIELHVAFYYHRKSSDFKYLNTTYHPINPPNWKFQTIKNHLLSRVIDQEDLSVYLDIIERVKPDLIHIHGTENPFRCIINQTKIPVVVSMQGIISIILKKFTSGIELKYLSAQNYNLKKGIKSIFFSSSFYKDRKLTLKKSIYELKYFPFFKYIIGRTDWDRRISSIMAPQRKYYHNDEILRDIFYTEKWTYPALKDKLILHTTIGNSPYKGFETICEAIFELNKANIQNIEWRVAGISESDLIVKVVKKKLKNRFPISGLVLLGNLDEKKLIEKLKEACIYVMPSHIENSSNSLSEAMILGIPCIATDAGGTSSLLKNCEDGILIQDGDPWSMAGAILELYRNKELSLKYGENARIRALKRHDKQKIVNDLLEIYKDIILNN